ncbi:7-carboxy-7-deazaguanine synthase QueE [Coraliomargarita sp. SDUM461004]|uniref:7-carboxy-7-deazaguanine synthase n=1 Tax=Thalassobacterium sedimentorum TaxID=3041258 RepID=A0ABU1AGS5_9BACT|nr:7-carboxy-7-deazaguanine synthase QueE [Coraliomargarita sp. SDUM461004]MDQ8193993.1 7-carboxy-7-deazaguanine synthase QueE [Coraliomargarita sp. SDUM461004]
MLPIHEQFYTFQGEGIYAGRAAYFIRTFGCPVHCPWCDSAGTWHPDYVPKQIQRLDVDCLVAEVAKTNAEFVVITGGEPAIHNLAPLVDALHELGQKVHLETSGAFVIKGDFDWITLSPKRWKLPLSVNLERAHEFKIIVDTPEAITEYTALLGDTLKPIWLHPEWSRHNDAATLDAITEWVKMHGAPFRAGWQMHKHYAADLKDSRSAPAAPLGGNPQQGF